MMDAATKIWWVRHLPMQTTEYYIGHSDVEAIIPSHAAQYNDLLPTGDAVWFSSPLKRAKATAKWLVPSTNDGDLHLAAELKEQNFGSWEGRRYDDVWEEDGQQYNWSRPELVKPPEGENFIEVCKRVDRWLAKLLQDYSGQQLVIVAHAGVIRAGIRHALDLNPAQALALQVDYGSVTRITYYSDKPVNASVDFVNRLSAWQSAA